MSKPLTQEDLDKALKLSMEVEETDFLDSEEPVSEETESFANDVKALAKLTRRLVEENERLKSEIYKLRDATFYKYNK